MAITWTKERRQLMHLIRAKDPALAEMYELAVDVLATHPITRGRLAAVSHCVRELTGALPHVLQDEGLVDRANVDRPAKALSVAWREAELPMQISQAESNSDELRTVPSAVYIAAQAVALAGSTASGNAWRKTAIMATGQVDPSDSAVIDRLHDAVDWFASNWVHVRDYSKPDRPLPDHAEVELRLTTIEQALLTRLGNMTDRARTVAGLLARANRRAGDGHD